MDKTVKILLSIIALALVVIAIPYGKNTLVSCWKWSEGQIDSYQNRQEERRLAQQRSEGDIEAEKRMFRWKSEIIKRIKSELPKEKLDAWTLLSENRYLIRAYDQTCSENGFERIPEEVFKEKLREYNKSIAEIEEQISESKKYLLGKDWDQEGRLSSYGEEWRQKRDNWARDQLEQIAVEKQKLEEFKKTKPENRPSPDKVFAELGNKVKLTPEEKKNILEAYQAAKIVGVDLDKEDYNRKLNEFLDTVESGYARLGEMTDAEASFDNRCKREGAYKEWTQLPPDKQADHVANWMVMTEFGQGYCDSWSKREVLYDKYGVKNDDGLVEVCKNMVAERKKIKKSSATLEINQLLKALSYDLIFGDYPVVGERAIKTINLYMANIAPQP